jgi:tetraacyldisaccharide-1-P 4'-kinase
MPLIYYTGKCNHSVSKFFRQAKDAPVSIFCPAEDCYHDLKKQLKSPSSASKIVVDNGFQARAVEIDPDIVEINEERSSKDYSKED